jgi:hypothetical protein
MSPGLELKLTQAPDLIVAGAAKWGTTTLSRWLLDHPSVIPAKRLENHFLTTGIHPHEVLLVLQASSTDDATTTSLATMTTIIHNDDNVNETDHHGIISS